MRATAARGEFVQWYAKALGPGGVVIARSGTRADPERVRVGAAVAAFDPNATEPNGAPSRAGRDARGAAADGGGGNLKWWLVGGGAAALVVGGVVTAVALSAGGGTNERTALSGPSLGP